MYYTAKSEIKSTLVRKSFIIALTFNLIFISYFSFASLRENSLRVFNIEKRTDKGESESFLSNTPAVKENILPFVASLALNYRRTKKHKFVKTPLVLRITYISTYTNLFRSVKNCVHYTINYLLSGCTCLQLCLTNWHTFFQL